MKEFMLIRERKDGTEEEWYSKQYVEDSNREAYDAGVSDGIKVEFHAVGPIDEDDDRMQERTDKLVKMFWDKVRETYENRLEWVDLARTRARKEFNLNQTQ